MRRILVLLLIDIVSVALGYVLWLNVVFSIISGEVVLPDIFMDQSSKSQDVDASWLHVLWSLVQVLGVPALVLLVLQVVLLAPVLGKPSIQPGKGRSLIFSGVLVGLVAAAMLTGLAMAIGEWIIAESPTFVAATESNEIQNQFDDEALHRSSIIFTIALPISWIIFGILFCLTLLRSQSPNRLKRLVLWVLVASAAEYVLLIPINVVVAKRSECYCVLGSSFALGFSVAAFAVLLGPFVLLVFCNHRYRALARRISRSNTDD